MMRPFRMGLIGLALAGLCACETTITLSPSPSDNVPEPRPEQIATAPSDRSEALRDYYTRVQNGLLVQGLLRTDGGGPDTPFNKRQMVDNFVQTAAFSEFSQIDGRFVEGGTADRVRRWTTPVNASLNFGARVPPKQIADDRRRTTSYLKRLSRLTGHEINLSQSAPNFHIAVLDVDELDAYGPTLQAFQSTLTPELTQQITTIPRDTYCAVFNFSDDNQITKSIVIIRAEHPDLLRASCFHEEIAQGLGLSNDSPAARPSIFNDDNEFAFLTTHDELLLRILYDDRLPLGATPDQARPIVNVIASELLGGES